MIIYRCNKTNKIEVCNVEQYCEKYTGFGFLLLKKYNIIYKENLNRFKNKNIKKIYALPFETEPVKIYLGMDRISNDEDFKFKEDIINLSDEDLNLIDICEVNDVYCKTKCKYNLDCENNEPCSCSVGCCAQTDIIQNEKYLQRFKSLLSNEKDYEIIFVKTIDSDCNIPNGYKLAGFDVGYDGLEPFGVYSIISDCMFIPKWHGCDERGKDFKKFYNKLNDNGLFDDKNTALEYLKHYLSFEWTERGDFAIYEIYITN